MSIRTALATLLALCGCGVSQAAIVEAHLSNSSSVLEFFHELTFPAEPAPGTQVTEVFGANVIETHHSFTVFYDSDYFSVVLESNYHTETAQVGARIHEYVGFFDPDTNELLTAAWQVISENIFEESFQVGASTQRLVQTGGFDPDDPPPPPQIVPLPPSGLLLGAVLSVCMMATTRHKRVPPPARSHAQSDPGLNPNSWSRGNRATARRS